MDEKILEKLGKKGFCPYCGSELESVDVYRTEISNWALNFSVTMACSKDCGTFEPFDITIHFDWEDINFELEFE